MASGDGNVHRTRMGLGNVGSYQISGHPYLTGGLLVSSSLNGEKTVIFPRVVRSFTVINKATAPIYIHFDSRANTDVITYYHYISLNNQDDSIKVDVKCKQVYISMANNSATGSFQLVGELTGIEAVEMPVVTGSGINSTY